MPIATVVLSIISIIAGGIVLYIAVNARNPNLLFIPDTYTVEFLVEWRDVATQIPTGYTTEGILSVFEFGVASFIVNSTFNHTHELMTTYTDGLLYGNTECVGSAAPGEFMGGIIAGITQSDINQNIELHSVGDPNCANGSVYSIHAFYANHFLCITDKVLKWVKGDAYTLTVRSFIPNATIIPPPMNATKCTAARSRMAATTITIPPIEKPKPRRSRRRLAPIIPKHVCFMPGLMVVENNMEHRGAAYWGNIVDYVPGGAAYTHTMSVNNNNIGWNSIELQDEYYNYIKQYRCSVVIAHSMGNTILTALAQRGKPVSWYMSQGSMRGSWGANYMDGICTDNGFMGYAANVQGYCTNNNTGTIGVKSLKVKDYRTIEDNACELGSKCNWNVNDKLCGWRGGAHTISHSTCWHCTATVADSCSAGYYGSNKVCADTGAYLSQTHEGISYNLIKGRMCGTSSYGMGGVIGLGLTAAGFLIDFGETNDGMVSMSSCAQASPHNKGQMLTPDATSKNYLLNGNHMDGTCINGNGMGGDQLPCVWMKNMIISDTGCAIPGFCDENVGP